jgi:hypothetical protein
VRRRLFNVAAALSLVLCSTTAALWLRSYWIADSFDLNGHVHESPEGIAYGQYGFVSAAGSVRVSVVPYLETLRPGGLIESPGRWVYTSQRVWQSPTATAGRVISFLWMFRLWPRGNGARVIFPHWLALILSSALPLLWLRRRCRQRQWCEQNRCPECGYDLRATPDRCPECGAIVHSDARTEVALR